MHSNDIDLNMSHTIGLENLPIDAVEYIGDFLSVNDISNCLAVSRVWYEVFNNDILWKKHCDINLGHYLQQTDCQVVPVFSVPRGSNCSLPPLSNHRLNYMCEQHLWRNWNLGRWKGEDFIFGISDNSVIEAEFVGNDFVFFHKMYNSEMWDVSQSPCHIMTIPFRLKVIHTRPNWVLHKASLNKLIVCVNHLVQVFNISLQLKSWSLDLEFVFTNSEVLSSNISEETNIVDIARHEAFINPYLKFSCDQAICGDYFVGTFIDQTSKYPVLHVWNVMTGEKLKEQLCDVFKFSENVEWFISFKVCEVKNVILILQHTTSGLRYGIYNLDLLKFLVISQDFQICYLFLCGQYLCNLQDSTLKYHDLLSNINFDSPYEGNVIELGVNMHLQALNDTELVFRNDNNEIIIVNLSSKLKSVILQVSVSLSEFSVFHGKFILCFHSGFLRELWKIDNPCKKLWSYHFNDAIRPKINEMCTKILLCPSHMKLTLLTFW